MPISRKHVFACWWTEWDRLYIYIICGYESAQEGDKKSGVSQHANTLPFPCGQRRKLSETGREGGCVNRITSCINFNEYFVRSVKKMKITALKRIWDLIKVTRDSIISL